MQNEVAVLLAERPRPEAIRSSRYAPWFAVATVCLGAFMGQLDASIVTLTFPALGRHFHTSLAAIEWVSLGYLVTLAALLVPAGRISDAAGRKAMYLLGFGLFTAASVGCGLAPTLPVLVAARVAQAVGAAMLQANSVALITTSVPGNRLRSALGTQAAAQAIGLALGPTVGGLLVHGVGWRWVFMINLPVGIAGLIAGRYLLPRTRHARPIGRFDTGGVVLLATATTAALLAISAGSGLSVPAVVPIAAAVLAAAAVAAFVARERRASEPLLALDQLRRPVLGGGLIAALLGYLVLFGPLVLGPYALAAVGVPGAATGPYLTALPLGFALAAVLGGRLLPARIGNRARGALGLGLAAAGMAVPALLGAAPAVLVPGLFATGFGLGIFTPANNAAVMAAVPQRAAGSAGGLVNTARALGTALGVALVTLVLHVGGGAGVQLSSGLLGIVAVAAGIVTLVSADRPAARAQRP
ncbi:MFS transporter [Actinocatenispora thailandica]|uniref:MFS transporter n=1 Tax=Actinocatenispora thailandica TaxID=227318 RepID=A0A7R7HUQ0_9ACTN|nr:MFS transporter [Actinocatenispora thailandica]BCJ32868.1 MFS transporter [Actinocatenispora thailandica]